MPELDRCQVSDLDVHSYLDTKFRNWRIDIFKDVPVPLSEDSPCDEGVCIRIEGMIPQIYKCKSPMFLQYETKLLDTGEEDLESSQTEGILNV